MKTLGFVVQTYRRHLVCLSAFFILSCSTYQSHVADGRLLMEQNQFDQAIEKFKIKAEESDGDKLAYLMEYATALHQAGRYEESNKIFLQADKLADLNDYTSVSRTAGTYVVNEGLSQYRAETFEYLTINVYQALNYMMLGDYDNAHVMSRRMVEKLNKLEVDKESKKKQASFAAYLSGLIWEAQGDWDNAYILYLKAHEASPDLEQYQRDLLIAARRSNRTDAYERLKKKWPQMDKSIPWSSIKNQGEFVFIFQQGWIPRKRSRPENRTLPMMVPVASDFRKAQAKIDASSEFSSNTVFDLEHVAVVTLDEDYKRLVAKALARAASREAVRQAAIHNKDNAALNAAALASIVFQVMDQADLRQWSTLPAYFQIIRVYLNPGAHAVEVNAIKSTPGSDDKKLWSGSVTVQKNKKIFMSKRAF